MAADEEKKTTQINVSFEKDPELVEQLDAMCEADFSDRSKFVRKLIAQEFQRRNGTLVPEKVKVIRQPASKTLTVAQA